MYYMYLKGDGTQILYTKQQYDNEYKYFKNAYFQMKLVLKHINAMQTNYHTALKLGIQCLNDKSMKRIKKIVHFKSFVLYE